MKLKRYLLNDVFGDIGLHSHFVTRTICQNNKFATMKTSSTNHSHPHGEKSACGRDDCSLWQDDWHVEHRSHRCNKVLERPLHANITVLVEDTDAFDTRHILHLLSHKHVENCWIYVTPSSAPLKIPLGQRRPNNRR